MNRLRFLGLRLARTLATLVIIVFITFAIFSLWPSDPAALACGKPCTPENLERARAFMGYDLPWYTRHNTRTEHHRHGRPSSGTPSHH